MRFLSLSLDAALELLTYDHNSTDWYYKLWACFQDPDLVLFVAGDTSVHRGIILYWRAGSKEDPACICKAHEQTVAVLQAYPTLIHSVEPGCFWRSTGGSISGIYDVDDPETQQRLNQFSRSSTPRQ